MTAINKKDEPDSMFGLLCSGGRGVIAGVLFSMAAALVLSAVLLCAEDPGAMLGWLPAAVMLVGALIGGFCAVRTDAGRSLLAGLIAGAGYVLLWWLVSLIFRGSSEASVPPLVTALMYAGCVLAALLGGAIGKGRTVRIREGKNNPAALARKKLGSR